jgi:diacylglycerol O-acyltransferase
MDTKGPDLCHSLSGTDAAFLYLERKEIPLHIACVAVFEESIPFDEFVATIDSKLHLIPRYRQIAVAPPFNIGYPTWEYDPHFDIHHHIVRVTLDAPGGDVELEELAGRVFSQVLDRNRPLWDIHVVDGLKGGRGALIARVHHALADGVAGASLLKVMLDPTPEGSFAIGKPRFQAPPAAPEPSLTDTIGRAIHSSIENLIAAEAGLLDLAQGLLSDRTQKGLQGLVTLLPELAASVERLPFNKPCGNERKFCWAEIDFGDVKAIRTAVGGTVNDVILTVVTQALARYVKLHGESVKNRFLRVVCPVNVRREDQGESLGNRISFLPVALPMDVQDPLEMLRAVALRMEIMKSVRAAELLAIAAAWLGAAPPPMQAFFWWGIPLVPMPLPLFNIICTNVPGSPTPLYSVGKRMISSYPQVPTGYELGVGCAVQSYNGKMCFGLTADAKAAPDVKRLRDFIQETFQELCRAAGVKKVRRRAAPVRKVRRRKAKPVPTVSAEPVQPEPLPQPEPAAPVEMPGELVGANIV